VGKQGQKSNVLGSFYPPKGSLGTQSGWLYPYTLKRLGFFQESHHKVTKKNMKNLSSIATPTLESKRVKLRPVNPDDYKTLFEWHSEANNLHLWWANREILTFDQFVEDFQDRLRSSIHIIMIIETQDNSPTPVGMTYNYNPNFIDRFTYLCIYLAPQYTGKGLGPEAGTLFVNYLFSYFGFRKIYAEVFEYNRPSVKATLANSFTEEGCLHEHRWFGDRYWDLHILAISREKFENNIKPRLV
jgi:RimJ/RimL family protein N-acetyltransferase